MSATIEIAVEPLTAKAFAPYGQLIAAGNGPASYSRPLLDVWHLDYRVDAPPRVQVMRYHRKPMSFHRLERHVRVTEGRIPLDRARTVLAVAGPTGDAPDHVPAPSSLRAFCLDGTAGLLFAPGIWHSLDCFPVGTSHADFLLLSDEATEKEIEAWTRPANGVCTHVVDYAPRGVEFRIVTD